MRQIYLLTFIMSKSKHNYFGLYATVKVKAVLKKLSRNTMLDGGLF